MWRELLTEAASLRQAGRLPEAEARLREALALAPDAAPVRTQLGVVLGQLGKVQEAKEHLARAVELQPDDPYAHMNLANALRLSGARPEALAHYREAVKLQPDLPVAWSNLLRPLLDACDWAGAARGLEVILERRRSGDAAWPSYLSPMDSILLPVPPEIGREIADFHATRISTGLVPLKQRTAEGKKRLRIAYFSRDFRNHAVGQLALSLFQRHDRERFEVHAYSYGRDDASSYRRDIAAAADRFFDVRAEPPAETARRIARDAVDILIDLGGHTTEHRLAVLAQRPAPVQVHYLGYPATLGGSLADYFITDHVASPAGQDGQFSERLVRLPNSFMVSDPDQPLATAVPSRSASGLPEKAIVFCAFHQSAKITEAVFDAWLEILAAVPRSILWLREEGDEAKGNLGDRARARGVDPQRLVFAPPAKHKRDHVARMAAADLFLDTFERYNGHSTVNEALWSALPVVTLAGATFASRVAASLVSAAGEPGLATKDAKEYVALAVRLAKETKERAALRSRLEAARATAPFFDTARTVRALEQAYEELWKNAS